MQLICMTRSRKTLSGNYIYYGLYKCPYCGKEIETDRASAKRQKSCGCMRKKLLALSRTTHGCTGTRLYKTWLGMRDRCFKKEHKSYKYYGARGITVCQDWADSFDAFRTWAETNGYEDSLQIDRINNDGNYEPSNCRFVSPSINARNKSNCVLSQEDVEAIRRDACNGVPYKSIGKRFSISDCYVCKIVKQRIWAA